MVAYLFLIFSEAQGRVLDLRRRTRILEKKDKRVSELNVWANVSRKREGKGQEFAAECEYTRLKATRSSLPVPALVGNPYSDWGKLRVIFPKSFQASGGVPQYSGPVTPFFTAPV
jgi:hypothetical protein